MPRSLNEPVGLAPSSFRRTVGADQLREHRRAQQRRRALLQADERIAGRERQPLAVALDQRHVRAMENAAPRPSAGSLMPAPVVLHARLRCSAHANSSSITRIVRGVRAHEVELAEQRDRRAQARLEHRVGDHHQPRVLAQAALHDRLDRDALLAEHAASTARARRAGRRPPGAGRRRSATSSSRAQLPAAAAGGRAPPVIALTTSPSTALAVCRPPAPGPDIVISVIASDSTVTALNGPVDRGERVPGVEERRVHAHRQPAVAALGGADQLQPEARARGRTPCRRPAGARCPRSGRRRGAPACRTPAARGSPSSPPRRGR